MIFKIFFRRLFFLFLLIPNVTFAQKQTESSIRQYIAIKGKWQFSLDETNTGLTEKWYSKPFSDFVMLPGTLDENKKGPINKDTTDSHLNRIYNYVGPAWFKKEIVIPGSWNDKQVELVMERTKVTKVWLDTFYIGTNNTIFSRQIYNLTGKVSGGKHSLTIQVDNTEKLVPIAGSHADSEDTQTNWNGIIGQFCLVASNPVRIETVNTYPDIQNKQVKVCIRISNPTISIKKADIILSAGSWNTPKTYSIQPKKYSINLSSCDSTFEIIYPLGEKMQLWSEFNPVLYKLTVSLKNENKNLDLVSVDFGMRDFKTQGTQFTINGQKTFLRGRHDACVFPLTGYPPMDTAGWMRMFRIVKSYGLNHVRFHTWCPPEAAFKAANILGIYLQPELPIWWSFNGSDSSQVSFMLKEGKHILDNYGNEPSFVMFTMGNEVYQDRKYMKNLVDEFRKYDNRHLYAQGSNNFGGNPSLAVGDDFWTTFRTANEEKDCSSDVRTSISFVDSREGGILNTLTPSTTYNYSKAIAKSPIPVIGHEIGQYQTFPNFTELPKYKGVLKPRNLELFKERIISKGMGDQIDDFFKASGALSALCYRADIETALRTPGFGGFQMLDLQDYPGQGTALVGILDAFMDNKGMISKDEFRQFCNDEVILLLMDKYCWTNNEEFKAEIKISNFSDSALNGKTINWNIVSATDGKVINSGKIENETFLQGSLTSGGFINSSLNGIENAQKVIINIKIEGSNIRTSYPLWVYPAVRKMNFPQTITETTSLSPDIIQQLSEGKNVLLFPAFDSLKKKSVPGMFISEFWNYAMFTGFAKQTNRGFSPGTMGILTNPTNPLFNDFPTEFYTNWQWWSIMKNSHPLILDETEKGYKPLVQVVDNINRNHKLGLIFEFKVGKGKLLVCMANLPSIKEKPEAYQLYYSILKYMNSSNFNPSTEITIQKILNIFD